MYQANVLRHLWIASLFCPIRQTKSNHKKERHHPKEHPVLTRTTDYTPERICEKGNANRQTGRPRKKVLSGQSDNLAEVAHCGLTRK
jgi:hypothetical protein